MRKKISKIALSGATLLSLATTVSADVMDPGTWLTSITTTAGDADALIIKILNWMIGLGAVICVVMLVFAGYSYMTAGGDEGKVGKASKTLTNAIIGLVICFIAVMLVNFVLKNFLGQGA